ncbi:uncharacterized protein LOC107885917 [Acyrthosiphon pisum]|uniref:MULE transposase domain-containing protein n=1 Tax=Acyrthosiphon pisum TaxID=7029 RepID=A0A8R2NRW0_ACYPI|nr:uncharacterized protein LOC107885917 [Acyrthosiphon pisum]
MLQIIIHKCAERNLFPDPQTINVDFEKAVINAIKSVIGEDVQIQGCFFHLCQSTHRKIQQLGLEQLYRSNEEFSHFCGMLDSLAFLPINYINTGLTYLKSVMSEEATDLVEYFERTYIGSYKRVGNGQSELRIKMRKTSPHFPPSVWNVRDATLNNGDRTNNVCEGWNNRFSNLVNHKHPTIWTLITKMRHENAADETKVAQRQLGTIGPPSKKKKKDILKHLCEEFDGGSRDIPNFLNAIANFIRK